MRERQGQSKGKLVADFAHDVPILRGGQRFIFFILHHLRALERLHAVRNEVVHPLLPGLVPLLLDVIVSWILLQTPEQERVMEPVLGRLHVSDGPERNLRVEVLREMEVEATLQHRLALRERLVLGFQLLLAHDYRDTLLVELGSALTWGLSICCRRVTSLAWPYRASYHLHHVEVGVLLRSVILEQLDTLYDDGVCSYRESSDLCAIASSIILTKIHTDRQSLMPQ